MTSAKNKAKYTYAQGWNACLRGEPYDSKAAPDWISGYNDCTEAQHDDTLFLDEGGPNS